jgi:hypothetical protein
MHIRPAAPHDAPAVAAIYNHGIAERQATSETRPRSGGGHPRRHGRLDGEWKDAVLVERVLGDAAH